MLKSHGPQAQESTLPREHPQARRSQTSSASWVACAGGVGPRVIRPGVPFDQLTQLEKILLGKGVIQEASVGLWSLCPAALARALRILASTVWLIEQVFENNEQLAYVGPLLVGNQSQRARDIDGSGELRQCETCVVNPMSPARSSPSARERGYVLDQTSDMTLQPLIRRAVLRVRERMYCLQQPHGLLIERRRFVDQESVFHSEGFIGGGGKKFLPKGSL